MNETAVVLNAVYKGTQMGLHSLDNIMDTVEDVNKMCIRDRNNPSN